MSAVTGVRRPVAGNEDVAFYVALYRRMLLIRRVEDLVQALFLRGEVYGTTHLYSGQEAVAVGVASALEESDRVACTYRGHGHAMALGLEPEPLLAELLGRSTGVNGGRAGSMNIVDRKHGLLGCYGIVGGSIAAATGAALALKGSGSVAVAYFGDGTANQAYFFECLNFAKVLTLPVVFVCENNGYGEYTPMADVTAGTIIDRAKTMEIPATVVDGMDVWATRAAALERSRQVPARRRARGMAGARSARARARASAGGACCPRARAGRGRGRRRARAGRRRGGGTSGAVPGARGVSGVQVVSIHLSSVR